MPLGAFTAPVGPAGAGLDSPLCGRCRETPPTFAYARAAARYGETVREALHAFKFGGRRALATPLGDLLAETGPLLPVQAVDLLVPVPLHRRRERERGFNQSWLLARRLASCWQVQALPDVLARNRATLPQTEVGAAERHRNVRGAFRVSRPDAVRDRHVLLVDDIMTTGATVGECAALLGAGGAATVGVVTVARVA